jgi:iron complex outermembrane receptor protein
MFSKKFLSGVALTALSMAAGAGVAHAQSTASQIQEEETIVVTGTRTNMGGVISAESVGRARSTVTQDLIDQQTAGQTIFNTINLVPGVNFTNTDPFGSSGGQIRMRGFDGNRVSLTFDGVPLNDTGNYAIFSNQMLDPELITRANVNMGSTDVDSPTASATGGTINYVTAIPEEEWRLQVQPSVGDFNYWRLFGRLDTGAFGPWDTRMFAAASFQEYDQFVGPGELQKQQYNVRVYQPLSGDDFLSLSFHWNENRNHFYSQGTLANWAADPEFQNNDTCARDAPTPGVADNDNAGSSSNEADPAGCTNYYNLRINPSNTGNLRGQARFSLGENLTLTFDPTVQYVLANGGGTTVVSETDARLRAGTLLTDSVNPACLVFDAPTSGLDLNGDCDTRDSVRLYSPSNTNTIRYNVLSSLIWDITETQRLIFGVTYDTGRHRQTGEYSLLDAQGNPGNVFGGKDGQGGEEIRTLAGTIFQKRDRLSIATLEQFSVRYIGDFFNDALTVDIGIRAPHFERELDQRCYVSAGSSSDPTCATGFVPAGVAPFKATVEYDDVLPSLGLVFRPGDDHQIFFGYSEGLSAPRTDDLYNGLSGAQLDIVEPETSQAYDLGYRYQGDRVILSTQVWYNQFQNRIVRVFDQDQGINISRNIGDVDLWGWELEAGYQVTDAFTAYLSTSYIGSEVQSDLPAIYTPPNPDVAYLVPTAGKELVETPDWTVATRLEYEAGPFTIGVQGKYVGERWVTDVNDLQADAYTTVDLDLRWDFGSILGTDRTYLQLNVINLFDETYFGNLSTQICSVNPAGTPPGNSFDCESGVIGTPRFNLGAPRTWMLSLRTQF